MSGKELAVLSVSLNQTVDCPCKPKRTNGDKFVIPVPGLGKL